jgi:hypothetical protein
MLFIVRAIRNTQIRCVGGTQSFNANVQKWYRPFEYVIDWRVTRPSLKCLKSYCP